MKKLLLASVSICFLAVSCNKSGGDGDNSPAASYLNTATGSTWNYEDIDNTDPATPPNEYSISSTNRDTSVSGRTYHVYSDDAGSSVYQGKSGNDYFAYEGLPDELGGTLAENLYLKSGAGVNANWTQSYPLSVSSFPVTAHVKQTIIEKGLTKAVSGNSYTNVIRVRTDISLSGFPAGFFTFSTDIQSYYAPNYGLIQRDALIEYSITGSPTVTSNTSTRLKTAVLL